ncbi:PQ loop repeat-domain-containing protein [Cunninghamella echinulata]|nr:PQ loop repeat-domain-containing protein [Cunninghamella echinulata]
MSNTCSPTVDGVPYIQWIYFLFGDCVYGWQECLSLLLGYLSIFCWLNAQMPQVIKNYKLGDADSLSFSFLTVWLIGDVANFIGCIATNQLPFQLYLSIYFIIIDTILCLQWIYYVKYPDNRLRRWVTNDEASLIKRRPSNQSTNSNESTRLLSPSLQDDNKNSYHSTSSTTRTKKQTTLFMIGLFSFYYTQFNMNTSTLTTSTSTSSSSSSMHMLDVSTSDDQVVWIGRFFAWLCTFLYLSSRLPQIVRNFQRQSVEGLSMALFFFAASGNFTYCLSIFTNPHATRKSMLEAVPYLIGSAGTLCFDATIFGQWIAYRHRSSSDNNKNDNNSVIDQSIQQEEELY